MTTAQTAADAASVVAATAAAATKVEAIDEEAAQMTVEGLGGSDDDTLTMAISRDRMGTTVSFTDTDMAGEDDPEFAMDEDLGGGLTKHVRTMAANDEGEVVEEVVMVSTDIDAPKATAFAMVAEQMLNARDLNATVDADEDGNTANDFTALAVVTANVGQVMSAAFTAGTAAVLTFDNNDDATDADKAFETAGAYNGAMGTYRCDGNTGCTVTIDGDGKISEVGAGWVFTPDAGVTSDVPDPDYLHYGFWLERTKDADGVVTSYDEVETFAESSVPASGSVASVTGSATYEGDSTGVYVRNVFDSLGEIDTATSGHFTADVVLNATFGQVPVSDTDNTGTIAENLLNTLTGTIDNFDLSGGEANAWAVNLVGDIVTADGTASGSANGGGAAGTFNATFHGPNEDADNDPIQPHTVVGEFGANFSNGSVAGGFGARK